MAKIRVSTNPLYKGGAGGYSFYVRSGEQVVRQRKNNSNYGETASRTYPQMVRRVKWSNLVNLYKVMKSWMPKAFENKSAGQTDYNLFMSLNANSVQSALTRDMSLADNCVIEPVQVSRGTLLSIGLEAVTASNLYKTSIKLSQAITGATTVAELAQDIISNNAGWIANDNLAVVKFINYIEPRVEWPVATNAYAELTLNLSDNRTLSQVPGINGLFDKSDDDFLTIDVTKTNEVGCVAIHTRKEASSLAVSSQNIVMLTDSIIQQFSGEAWVLSCIETYGLDSEVPLDPSFRDDIITRVTANGVAVSNAETLTGSQQVRVYGNALNGSGYRFVHNGIEYTPLSSTDEYDEYILTDNGAYYIYIDSSLYMSFNVTGVVVPSGFPTFLQAALKNNTTNNIDNSCTNVESDNPSMCLNYAHKVTSSYPNLIFVVEGTFTSADQFTLHNCTLLNSQIDEGVRARLVVTPTDTDQSCYISYGDIIIFVGNY